MGKTLVLRQCGARSHVHQVWAFNLQVSRFLHKTLFSQLRIIDQSRCSLGKTGLEPVYDLSSLELLMVRRALSWIMLQHPTPTLPPSRRCRPLAG